MNAELTTNPNARNGNRELTAPKNRVKKHLEEGGTKQISRNGLTRLHQSTEAEALDLRDTKVSKGINAVSDMITSSLNSSVSILSTGSKGLIDAVKQGSKKNGLRSALLAGLGTIFALKTFKGLLEFPKRLTDKENQGQYAPLLLSGAKWVAGGTLALGAIRAFTSGNGISNPTIITGLIAFAGLSLITSAYENENSAISKILTMLGLRDKVKSLTNDLQTDQLITN